MLAAYAASIFSVGDAQRASRHGSGIRRAALWDGPYDERRTNYEISSACPMKPRTTLGMVRSFVPAP